MCMSVAEIDRPHLLDELWSADYWLPLLSPLPSPDIHNDKRFATLWQRYAFSKLHLIRWTDAKSSSYRICVLGGETFKYLLGLFMRLIERVHFPNCSWNGVTSECYFWILIFTWRLETMSFKLVRPVAVKSRSDSVVLWLMCTAPSPGRWHQLWKQIHFSTILSFTPRSSE